MIDVEITAAQSAIDRMTHLRQQLKAATSALDAAEAEFQAAERKLREAQLAQMIAVAAIGDNADDLLANVATAFATLLEARH